MGVPFIDSLIGTDISAPPPITATDLRAVLNAMSDVLYKDQGSGTAIPFNSMNGWLANIGITANIVFTKNLVNQFKGGACSIIVIADGVHTVDVTQFAQTSNYSFVNTSGTKNLFYFFYDGTEYSVSCIQIGAASGGGDVTPPTVIGAAAPTSTHIDITFSESVTGLTLSGWSFKKNGSAFVPTSVSMVTSTVAEFIMPTMLSTDVLLVSYSGSGGVTDLSSNPLAAFTDMAVSNSIGGSSTLTAPVLNTPTVVGSTELDLLWSDPNSSPNEISIELQGSPDGSTWTGLGGTLPANTVTYHDTGLSAGQTKFYRVRAVGNGSTILTSAWSNIVSATTGASGPVDLAFVTPSDPTATWTKTTDANGDIYVAAGSAAGIVHTQGSPKSLPANTTGRIWAKYAAADAASNAQLYFKDIPTAFENTADYGTSKWEIDFHQSGNLYFSRLGTFTLLEAMVVGTYYGIYRDGSTGTIKVQKSTDQTTWTDVTGGTFSDTSLAQLYPFTDLDGTIPGKLYYPKGIGVV